MDTSHRLIASHYLLTNNTFLPRPLIEVDIPTHTIISVGQYGDNLDSMEGVEFYSGIICAGFVNAHTHIELSYLHGAIAQKSGYAGFAATMAQVRDNYTLQNRIEAIQKADRQMWKEGVDLVADISNSEESFATKAESKIEYHNFLEVFGLKNSNITKQKELLKYPNTSLTAHSTYSVQSADFDYIAHSSANILSLHFLESEAEKALYKGYGTLWEWYNRVGFKCDFLQYSSPTQRVVESIPSSKSILLIHNCDITAEDIDIINKHFTTPVWWVVCPRSNRYISGKYPNNCLTLLQQKGANIAIGTDSLASNESLSILEEIKSMQNIPLATALTWVTIGGAKALQRYGEFGEVCVGAKSGIINISGVDLDSFTLLPTAKARRIY